MWLSDHHLQYLPNIKKHRVQEDKSSCTRMLSKTYSNPYYQVEKDRYTFIK